MNHGAQPPEPPRGESPRAIAWTALLVALIALGVSVFVFLQSYDGGRFGDKLKANVKQARTEVEKVIEERASAKAGDRTAPERTNAPDRANAEESGETDRRESVRASEDDSDSEGSAFNLDRIKGRIDEAREMVSRNSPQARAYLDRLREELVTIRDYGSEKKDIALEKAIKAVDDAKGKLDIDKDSAKESLQRLSRELADQARKAASGAPAPEPATEPPTDHRWPGDGSARTPRRADEPAE